MRNVAKVTVLRAQQVRSEHMGQSGVVSTHLWGPRSVGCDLQQLRRTRRANAFMAPSFESGQRPT